MRLPWFRRPFPPRWFSCRFRKVVGGLRDRGAAAREQGGGGELRGGENARHKSTKALVSPPIPHFRSCAGDRVSPAPLSSAPGHGSEAAAAGKRPDDLSLPKSSLQSPKEKKRIRSGSSEEARPMFRLPNTRLAT